MSKREAAQYGCDNETTRGMTASVGDKRECLCRFVVDIVDALVVAVFGLCENLTLIVSLDSCTPIGVLNKFSLDLT